MRPKIIEGEAIVDSADGTSSVEELPGSASSATDKLPASVSLLPVPLIELCDLASCPLMSLPLPQSVRIGSSQISLAELNIRQVGDLHSVSPLTLLALTEARSWFDEHMDGIWSQALADMPTLIAPVLESVMARPLSKAFALPHIANRARESIQEPKQPDPSSQVPYSALFFEPDDVIEDFSKRRPLSMCNRVWTPSGLRNLDGSIYLPGQTPLLSFAVQQALEVTGCDLVAGIDVLPLDIRTLNTCVREGDRTLSDLVSRSPEHLFGRRNFGPKSYVDIVLCLRVYLAPWLATLSCGLILGEESANDRPEPQPQAISAKPEQPLELAPDGPADPFAALRNSDLIAALDLYGVSWRDIPVSLLAPETVARPLADIADADLIACPAPLAKSSPLEEADGNLRKFVQLLAASGLDPALADLPAGALVEPRDAATDIVFARIPAHQADHVLGEIVKSLTTLLLKHALRLDAFHEVLESAEAILHRVTMADLMAELTGAHASETHSKRQPADILYVRKGLYDGQPQTLEDVGRRFGVTRERIRQIEKKALDHLESPRARLLMHTLSSLVEFALRAFGGVATLADVSARLGGLIPFGYVHPEASTRFLVEWCPDVMITADSLLFVQPYTESLIRQTQQILREIVTQQANVARDSLITQALITGGEQVIAAGAQFVAAALETLKDIVAHGERYQVAGRRSTKSRIIQAMHNLGRPATVAEIGAEYRRLYPDESQRTDNSIRGFFDRFHDTFVLVGLSTYALAEWGYDPAMNNIRAVVEHILGYSNRPLRREEVVERALAKYRWKAQSISAQLDTNPHIRRFGHEYFGLRDLYYGEFDTEHAGENVKDDDKHIGRAKTTRERLAVANYTNNRGNRVVQVRLSARCLGGYIPLTSQPIRELLPDVGKFCTEVWPATDSCKHLIISRTAHDISGFSPLLSATRAHAGDALFIERLAVTPAGADDNAPMYRIALAHADDLIEAMDVVGLDADDSDATPGVIPVLHYTHKPHKLAQLIEYAIQHPWMQLSEASVALNCMPSNPASREYLQLAQMTGVIATSQSNPHGSTTILRPTTLGRRWSFSAGDAWEHAQKLVLSLPAYRGHLRSLDDTTLPNVNPGAEKQCLGGKVLAAWDRVCGITGGEPATQVLGESAALISTDLLVGPALPLLLLLLMAQTQGRGLELPALAAPLSGQARTGLRRLQEIGLAIIEDDNSHIALAERVNVAVATPNSIAEMLRASVADTYIASAFAQMWRGGLRTVAHGRLLHASDLYNGLHALAADFLYGAFASPPIMTPEYTLDVDMALPFCGFPSLTADWAVETADNTSGDAYAYQTVITYANRDDNPTGSGPIGVVLCDDLLGQSWDVAQHLAGNAHLALLTVIAADEGNLADYLFRLEGGWRLAGTTLVSALDALLLALGYDVWNERYREDPDQQTRLGDALVALAERLNIVKVVGARLEAVNGVATRLYYDACDRSFIQRLTEALNSVLVLA